MIDWFTGICSTVTDFVVGSKIRSKFETIAVEMEAQDFAWYQSLKKAIPIAIYQAFDFNLIPAQKATGYVTFTAAGPASSNITIPTGTQVSNGLLTLDTEVIYTTTAFAIIAIGQTSVTVPVASVNTGASNNLDSLAIDKIVSTLNAPLTVTNNEPLAGGADRETETERRLRFIEYISTISRGTAKAVEYGAKTAMLYDVSGIMTERIHDAIVYEPFMHDITKPVGVFECYIYNGSGDTSDEIKELVENTINGYNDADGNPVPGWKAAGVICNVIKATETAVKVTADITILAGYSEADTETTAIDVANSYIAGLGIGKQFIYNELVERLMGIQGVYNVQITEPASDQTPEYNEVYIPCTTEFTVTSL